MKDKITDLSIQEIIQEIKKEVTKQKKIEQIITPKDNYIEQTKVKKEMNKTFKTTIKSIPILGWFIRWCYNLLRLNNTKHNLYIMQQQLNTLIATQRDINARLEQKVDENTLIVAQRDIDEKLEKRVDENTLLEVQRAIDKKIEKRVDENTLLEVQRAIDKKIEKKLENKVDENTLLEVQRAIDKKIEKRVDENTLLVAQRAIDDKLEKKVNKDTLTAIQKDIENRLNMPDIPASIEIVSDDFLSDAISKFPHAVEKFKDFNKDELYYSLFESTFYNHTVVLEKQKVYLQYIPEQNSIEKPHLDIGCGRGEFLSILRDNNLSCMGIDINNLEIQELKKQDFEAEHIDMIEFLQTTQKTFSSISALQVIEHIEYSILKEFIALSYEKIEKGGVLILETINPHNKVALNSFYMDETHKRPLPPEMVAFMLQYLGFKNIKFRYTSPMPQEFRSKISDNINYHDYAVVGYKI